MTNRLEWLDGVLSSYFASPAATVPQTSTYFLDMLDSLPVRPATWDRLPRPQRFTTINNRLKWWFQQGWLAKGPKVPNANGVPSNTWVRRDVAKSLVMVL